MKQILYTLGIIRFNNLFFTMIFFNNSMIMGFVFFILFMLVLWVVMSLTGSQSVCDGFGLSNKSVIHHNQLRSEHSVELLSSHSYFHQLIRFNFDSNYEQSTHRDGNQWPLPLGLMWVLLNMHARHTKLQSLRSLINFFTKLFERNHFKVVFKEGKSKSS